MSDISKINIENKEYKLKDAEGRARAEEAATEAVNAAKEYTNAQLNALKGAVSADFNTLEKIEDKIEELDSSVDERFSNLNESLDTSFDGIDEQIGSTNAKVSQVETTANNALALAQSKNLNKVFETTSAMYTWLANAANKGQLQVGSALYIKEADVPDWWVTEVLNTPNASGRYYNIAPLEAEGAGGPVGSTVSVQQKLTSGTEIGSITVDGTPTKLYAPDAVTYNKATTSTDGLMSAQDKTKLDGIVAGAEVNQNAFSSVVVGSTTIAADSKTDTLTLVAGNNVTITPDATNDKITIAATDTTYSAATQSAQGLMSAADKKKLDGVAVGANAYIHPTTSGNKHIPAGGASGQILKWSADGTAVWAANDVAIEDKVIDYKNANVFTFNNSPTSVTYKYCYLDLVEGKVYFDVTAAFSSSINPSTITATINNSDLYILSSSTTSDYSIGWYLDESCQGGFSVTVPNIIKYGGGSGAYHSSHRLIGYYSIENRTKIGEDYTGNDAVLKMKNRGLPLAHGVLPGAVKSASTTTSTSGYGACPIVSGAPYYKIYDASTHNHSKVLDAGDGRAITFAYSKDGMSTTSWLASWNGAQLEAISPGNALKAMNGLPLSGGTMTGVIKLTDNYGIDDTNGNGFLYRSTSATSFGSILNKYPVYIGTMRGNDVTYLRGANIVINGTNYIYASQTIAVHSDQRVKNNESLISEEIDKYVNFFDKLQPRKYNYTRDEEGASKNIGFFAQEVHQALSDSGLELKDFAGLHIDETFVDGWAEGTSEAVWYEDFYSLAYEQFIPIIVAKIQHMEQQYNNKIKTLEEEYNNKLINLEERLIKIEEVK